jgi:hypothetical protein
MKIEVLYVPFCPNYAPTVERLQKVLESLSVRAEICTVAIKTEAQAKAFLFLGSPTVRVNGQDVEPSPGRAPSLACRLYSDGKGIPPEELVRAAVIEARQRE